MSSNDSAMLSKQKELLMERLADFEATNRTLRKMLRDRHESEATGLRLTEQRDLLLKKLSETEDLYQRLRSGTLDKDRQINDLRLQIEAQKVRTNSVAIQFVFLLPKDCNLNEFCIWISFLMKCSSFKIVRRPGCGLAFCLSSRS